MEFASFVLNFMQIFTLVSVLTLIFSFFFKNKKELVYIVYYLILLVMINYFVIAQKDYIFENFPKQAYGMLILLLLSYFIFFRSVYFFVSAKKTKRDIVN